MLATYSILGGVDVRRPRVVIKPRDMTGLAYPAKSPSSVRAKEISSFYYFDLMQRVVHSTAIGTWDRPFKVKNASPPELRGIVGIPNTSTGWL